MRFSPFLSPNTQTALKISNKFYYTNDNNNDIFRNSLQERWLEANNLSFEDHEHDDDNDAVCCNLINKTNVFSLPLLLLSRQMCTSYT